jgi:hypothetical protein
MICATSPDDLLELANASSAISEFGLRCHPVLMIVTWRSK